MERSQDDPAIQRLAEIFEGRFGLSEDAGAFEKQEQLLSVHQQPQPVESPVKYNMSQHYTHSAHVTSSPSSSPSPSLHPLQPRRDDHVLHLLIQNDIAPSSLLRSQLDLFERSDIEERARLTMLWRLAPPTYARNGGQRFADQLGEYQSTTLRQEEEMAWIRYQQNVSRRDERADARAEQLCGRQSLLGGYFESDQHPEVDSEVAVGGLQVKKDGNHPAEDEEML